VHIDKPSGGLPEPGAVQKAAKLLKVHAHQLQIVPPCPAMPRPAVPRRYSTRSFSTALDPDSRAVG